MTTTDMINELAATVAKLSDKQRRWLRGQGINAEFMDRAAPLGTARVYPDSPTPGMYEPADCGRGDDGTIDVIVQAVLYRPLSDGETAFRILDLVAWDPRDPARWWLRFGGVATFLNESAIDDAGALDWDEELMGCARPRLRLYATPLDWLRDGARRDGSVLLSDGGRLWRDLFAGVGGVIVNDTDFAAVVYKKLRKRGKTDPLPEVLIDEPGKEEQAA